MLVHDQSWRYGWGGRRSWPFGSLPNDCTEKPPQWKRLITSLTSSESLRFPPPDLSLRWYYALLDADQMQRAAWNSLIIAF